MLVQCNFLVCLRSWYQHSHVVVAQLLVGKAGAGILQSDLINRRSRIQPVGTKLKMSNWNRYLSFRLACACVTVFFRVLEFWKWEENSLRRLSIDTTSGMKLHLFCVNWFWDEWSEDQREPSFCLESRKRLRNLNRNSSARNGTWLKNALLKAFRFHHSKENRN